MAIQIQIRRLDLFSFNAFYDFSMNIFGLDLFSEPL